MDPAHFLTSSGIAIVAGKGGVGKTTVTGVLGLAAARSGLRTLMVEIEGKHGLARLFDHGPLAGEMSLVAGGRGRAELWARTIVRDESLRDYLDRRGLWRLVKRFQGHRVIETLANSTPGIKDLLVLGDVRRIADSGQFDLVILDAPATGHALSFLRSAEGVLDTVSTGPIREQAEAAAAMLADPTRAQVILVTIPEETPVNELVDAAYALEEDIGVALGPVVVNGVLPTIDLLGEAFEKPDGVSAKVVEQLRAAARFRMARAETQQEQLGKLDEVLPLQQIRLPFRFTTRLGADDLDVLSDRFLETVEALPEGATS